MLRESYLCECHYEVLSTNNVNKSIEIQLNGSTDMFHIQYIQLDFKIKITLFAVSMRKKKFIKIYSDRRSIIECH